MSVTSDGYCSTSPQDSNPHECLSLPAQHIISQGGTVFHLNQLSKTLNKFPFPMESCIWFLYIFAFRKVFFQPNFLYQSETLIYTGNSYGSASEFFLSGAFALKLHLFLESHCTINKFFYSMLPVSFYSNYICLQ